ncbi:hypothetical protein CTAYLR_007952 [Chrysophaeum taylorii]|uniref:ABM domain-containing protein n=1 Tax=Chrysophaeum taylorii TaxID=2483200 RepID=A0AAD7UBP9_9STRA|nr:hypothetical protein CTAYLR_007952 [Chrysophaeum taylorii]
MMRRGPLLFLLVGVVLGLVLANLRAQRHNEKAAFVLLVDIEFASEDDRDTALRHWRPVADHCRDNEPGTLTYEAAVSDSDPRRIVFLERYADKHTSYLKIHKSSQPFLKFRKKLADMNPIIKGHSYVATDIGFI